MRALNYHNVCRGFTCPLLARPERIAGNRSQFWVLLVALVASDVSLTTALAEQASQIRARVAADPPLRLAEASPVGSEVDELLRRAEQAETRFQDAQTNEALLRAADDLEELCFRVLDVQPDNEQANAVLRELVRRLTNLASSELLKGDLELAQEFATKGIGIEQKRKWERSPALAAVEVRITEIIAEARDRPPAITVEVPASPGNEIAQLLEQAQNQLRRKQLTKPVGENAFETYSEVLKRDRNNPEAKGGLQTIAETYETWAKGAMSRNDLDKASRYVESGLKVMKSDPGLLALKEQVGRRKQPYALLTKADELSRVSECGKEVSQATILYRQVLETDQFTDRARSGLARIATQCEAQARTSIDMGAWEEVDVVVQRGLHAQPTHAELQQLQSTARQPPTSELTVKSFPGAFWPPAHKSIYELLIDGEKRGELTSQEKTTTLSVRPGSHKLRVIRRPVRGHEELTGFKGQLLRATLGLSQYVDYAFEIGSREQKTFNVPKVGGFGDENTNPWIDLPFGK